MFLRPAQLLKREKVHGIVVDFVDNIVPRQDNRTFSEGGSTKLVVSYGPKKSRLEQVTLSHNRPKPEIPRGHKQPPGVYRKD